MKPCADELAVEVVDPPVVRALERAGVAGGLGRRLEPLLAWPARRGGDAHAAVLADLGHHVDLARGVADHDDLLLAHERGGEVVAGVRDPVDPADAHPAVVPDRALLELVERRIGVCLRRKGDRLVELDGRGFEGFQRKRGTIHVRPFRGLTITP
jgi:hypothetical protein